LNLGSLVMIRYLDSGDPALNEAAWESLRGVVGMLGPAEEGAGSRKYQRAV
jgi:hypothetical protein